MISSLLLSKILTFENLICDSIHEPVMNSIVKYRAHPSTIAIKQSCASDTPFTFLLVKKENIL